MSFSTLILAAGAGTRMKSKRAKVAHELLGKPLVRWVVNAARQAGAEHIVTVVGHQREQVIPLVKDTTLVVQEERLGTGHALMVARKTLEHLGLNKPGASLVVLAGDTPLLTPQTIAALVAAQQNGVEKDATPPPHARLASPEPSPAPAAVLATPAERERPALSVLTFYAANPTGYGRIVREPPVPSAPVGEAATEPAGSPGVSTEPPASLPTTVAASPGVSTSATPTATPTATPATPATPAATQRRVLRIVEEKDATPAERALTECNSAAYCFDGPFLLANLDRLTNTNAQGEYYLTDLVELAVADGRLVCAELAEEGETQGINSRVQLAQATKVMQARINQAHMEAGVTMLDPSLVWIGPEVTIGPDTELLPLTMLQGSTSIGENSVIGPNSRISDSRVGRACRVEESILCQVTLEDEVQVGPRAYLRPGTLMRRGSKAGTHVELKNSIVGPNSKVPHLSYLGDATLGESVNIGAGAITCNYNGQAKHSTVIGDRAFIGSDTMLVAPVRIGADTITGAGSVITNNVPDGALALERAEQTIKEDWAVQHKKQVEKDEPAPPAAASPTTAAPTEAAATTAASTPSAEAAATTAVPSFSTPATTTKEQPQ